MVDHRRDATAPPASRQAETAAETADPASGGGERVAKALARAGVASRRAVERLIAEGRVALNGRVLDTPAVKVEPGDLLTVDGALVEAAEATRLWRYHKPAGLITTNSDPLGRPTVFDHLPDELPRVVTVGRLDLATEGLLLLTNDGGLARALELPSSGWVRRYRARAYGRITQAKLDTLKAGITIEGVAYGPIEARLDKAKPDKSVERTGPRGQGEGGGEVTPANVWISVALTEGKNREVRRVLEALGLKVNRLIRLAYGPFALGDLPVGEAEEVGPRVIREQLEGLVPSESMPKGDRAPLRPKTGSRRGGGPVAALKAVGAAEAPARAAPARKPSAKAAPRGATEIEDPRGPRRGRAASAKPGRPAGKPAAPPRGGAGKASGPKTAGPSRPDPSRPGASRGPAKRPGAPSGKPPRRGR